MLQYGQVLNSIKWEKPDIKKQNQTCIWSSDSSEMSRRDNSAGRDWEKYMLEMGSILFNRDIDKITSLVAYVINFLLISTLK